MWWADQGTDQIGTCDKSDGGNWKVLRNNTSPMMHMKIYNETVQQLGVFSYLYFHIYSCCNPKMHVTLTMQVKMRNYIIIFIKLHIFKRIFLFILFLNKTNNCINFFFIMF